MNDGIGPLNDFRYDSDQYDAAMCLAMVVLEGRDEESIARLERFTRHHPKCQPEGICGCTCGAVPVQNLLALLTRTKVEAEEGERTG